MACGITSRYDVGFSLVFSSVRAFIAWKVAGKLVWVGICNERSRALNLMFTLAQASFIALVKEGAS